MKRFILIVTFNVAVISILGTLDAIHVLPIYPLGLIAIAALYAANMLFMWRTFRRPGSFRIKGGGVLFKLVWLGAAAYTAATFAMTVSLIRKPNVSSAAQVVLGILLSWYCWSLVSRLREK
jgi:hypothetical protein